VGKPDEPSQTLAPGRIGAAAVTFFALAATAPIAVLFIAVPAAYARGGGLLVPLGFVAVAIVLLLFASSYAAMAHRAPFAGALYVYVARGLGRPAGTAAAWVALAAYHCLQFGLYGVVGIATAPLLTAWFRQDAAWWQVAAACWLLVAVLGTVRIEIVSGLFALLVIAELALIAGFAAANILHPATDRTTPGPVLPIDRPALGMLLAVAVLAFIGFETTGTYAEETIRPRRQAGRATTATVLVFALLLAFAAWSVSVGAGSDRVAALAREHGSELVFYLASARLAPWAVILGRVLLLGGLLMAMLALHNTIARYLFALGRERVLPGALGRTARRTGVPRAASLTQSVLAGLALLLAYLSGVDAPVILVRGLAVAGGLGVLVLLLATALAALLHLNQVPNGEGTWGRFVAPALSTVGLGTLGYLAFSNLPALLDAPPHSAAVWSVPAVVAAVAGAGALHGLALRAARPVGYAGIGHGGVPVVVTPQLPHQREPGAHRPERVDR
jgi:amino acid transporter